jgi:transposase
MSASPAADDSNDFPLPAWMMWICTLLSGLFALLASQKEEIALQQKAVEDHLALIATQKEEIASLQDEIACLKGHKPRPKIKPQAQPRAQPSGMENGSNETDRKPGDPRSSKGKKRPRNGGGDRSVRTSDLTVHEDQLLKPADLPEGARFKDRKRYVVQDLRVEPHVIRYHRERYVTPDGQTVIAPLPSGVSGHYGPGLIAFVLYQHYEQKVPEPKILDFLHSLDIKISTAQLNRLLTEGKESFHAEKDEILKTGLEVSQSITVDDTSARHKGQNHITTHIGNDLFAWFKTTPGKTRRNFLELIQEGGTRPCWRINAQAIAWWQDNGLSANAVAQLTASSTLVFDTEEAWSQHLDALGVVGGKARAIATEGALWGEICDQALLEGIAIISDGAPQFVVGLHGRCWVHAERQIHSIICVTDAQRKLVQQTRSRVWKFYYDLKCYKKNPKPADKKRLEHWFDRIFNQKPTGFSALDAVLDRLFAIKAELLLVLDRPDVPLHTNGSEGDIRCRVEERKISGGTRGDQGKRCNDTFAAISKTLRKHRIRFYDYLRDRLGARKRTILPISDIIRNAATGPPQPA